MRILMVSSAFLALAFGCGGEEDKDTTSQVSATSGNITFSCTIDLESLGQTTCTETRDVSQAVSDTSREYCTSDEISMTFAETPCPNKDAAPGVCTKVEEGITTYTYQSGDTMTAAIAQEACEGGDSPGTYTAK